MVILGARMTDVRPRWQMRHKERTGPVSESPAQPRAALLTPHHSSLGHLHYGLTWSWKDQKKLYYLLLKALQALHPPSVTKDKLLNKMKGTK